MRAIGAIMGPVGSSELAAKPTLGEVRYYSPAGPIRIDAAFPVNGRSADDAFQIYFSIGQTF